MDVLERAASSIGAPQLAGPGHLVQFYEHDAFLIDSVAEFIGTGLEAGEAGIVIATPPHRAALSEALSARGIDLAQATRTGRYVALDAAQMLAGLMVEGWPNEPRFARIIGGVIDAAAAGGRGVRAFGEMVALLCERSLPDAAIQLERLWNQLAERRTFSLFCAYPMALFDTEGGGRTLQEVCCAHSHVCPAESFAALRSVDAQARAIAELQHKASVLQAEIVRRRAAEQQLRDAAQRKDEFLAMLAHELRNPLSPLTNAHHLLDRSEPLSDTGRQALALAQRQTRQLTRLVDDLLEVSRVSRGKIALRCEPVWVASAVYQAVESVNAAIGARAQDLRVSVPDRPLQIMADPARIAQVLENLLTNASKYTPEGGAIRVQVQAAPDAVEIRVTDNGVGIEPHKVPQLFELFSQLDATLDRSQGGLGIGLALVKRLVELHGGSVTAASDGIGQGATFTVRLPREPVHWKAAPDTEH